MKKTLISLGVMSAALFANPYENTEEEIASVIAAGQKASAALLERLGGNLQKHMKEGGPVDALHFCSEHAYALTDEVDKELGGNVSIKRISLKYRNPANAPQEDEKAILTSLEALSRSGIVLPKELVEVVGDGSYKFYKPLQINKPVCLTCHGDLEKSPALRDEIAERYPQDRATGYAMNDLRGVIVVTIKK